VISSVGAVTLKVNQAGDGYNIIAGAPSVDDNVLTMPVINQASMYHGAVDLNGDAISLPAGWSSSQTATGILRIDHNIGGSLVTNTIIIASGFDFVGAGALCSATVINQNNFTIESRRGDTGILIGADISFIFGIG